MTDFLNWVVQAWANLLSFLGSVPIWAGASFLGLLLAFIVIPFIVRQFIR